MHVAFSHLSPANFRTNNSSTASRHPSARLFQRRSVWFKTLPGKRVVFNCSCGAPQTVASVVVVVVVVVVTNSCLIFCRSCGQIQKTTIYSAEHDGARPNAQTSEYRWSGVSCMQETPLHRYSLVCGQLLVNHTLLAQLQIIITRGQSNLTKSASRGAHSPVRGHPRGSKVVPLNSWGRVSY